MAVQDFGPTERTWEGRLLDCCGNCDAEGVSTFAYVKYCSPIAWGHNMKRAFNLSFWKYVVIFVLCFTAWWWLYVGLAAHTGVVCGPPPPLPVDRPLPADPAWKAQLPEPPIDKTILAGATWQPEKFLPQMPEEPETVPIVDLSQPEEEDEETTEVQEVALPAIQAAEDAAIAAEQEADEIVAAAEQQAEELTQQAGEASGEAVQKAQEQVAETQETAQQASTTAQQNAKQALKELQDQFNAQLDQAPDNEQLNAQIQMAKQVVADGMAQLNAQLTGMGRKLLHKHHHDDDDDDEDEEEEEDKDKKHKDKKHKDKKHKKDKRGEGMWHGKDHWFEHPGPEGHPDVGPESHACKVAQKAMAIPWLLALFFGFMGVIIATKKRTAMRERFGIAGDARKDFLAWLCCAPCALCQETRTLAANNVRDGVWYGPTMLAAPTHPLQAPPQQVAEGKPVKGDEFNKV